MIKDVKVELAVPGNRSRVFIDGEDWSDRVRNVVCEAGVDNDVPRVTLELFAKHAEVNGPTRLAGYLSLTGREARFLRDALAEAFNSGTLRGERKETLDRVRQQLLHIETLWYEDAPHPADPGEIGTQKSRSQ